MPRGKSKVQRPASGGGRAKRARRHVVEEDSSEEEVVHDGSVPEAAQTQFTQLSQLEAEDDDSNGLWRNGDDLGPMEAVRGEPGTALLCWDCYVGTSFMLTACTLLLQEIEDLVEWRPLTSSQDSDLVDIPSNVHEACVKWVTKYFLAESMQQQNRTVIDLYTRVAKEVRDYAGANFGMLAKTGKKRALKREDIDNVFVGTRASSFSFVGVCSPLCFF